MYFKKIVFFSFFHAHRKQAITKPLASVEDEYKNVGL
jgi:hypothetical protein